MRNMRSIMLDTNDGISLLKISAMNWAHYSCSPQVSVILSINTGTYYRFGIGGYGLDKIPSILFRKKAHKRQLKKDITVTSFIIKHIGKKKCYQLETKNDLLLLSDFTILHK